MIRLGKYFLCFCMLLNMELLHAATPADSLVFKQIKRLSDSVGKVIAPDKRTAIFKTDISGTTTPTVALETTDAKGADVLRQAFQKAGLNVKVDAVVLPAAGLGEKRYGVVSLSVVNIRRSPDHAAELMTQATLGTPLQILKKENGYYLVRTPDQYISYVEQIGIASMDAKAMEEWNKAKKLVFTPDYGFSYSKADEKSLRVSDLVNGSIVRLIGKEKNFYQVAYPDNRIAYIPVAQAIAYEQWVKRPNPTSDQILSAAKTMMGVPYLWGGTSVKGVDCSGFTKTSFFLNGIVLPRDASQQALVGETVDIMERDSLSMPKALKNLQPGDLLFFAASKGKVANPRVTHVAIYMGKGQFIQSAGLVRINSFDPAAKDYTNQSRTIVSARRMLSAIGQPEITRIDQHNFYTTVQR